MNATFEIGLKEITTAEIYSTREPSRAEMSAFCNTLGLLVENQVPLLEAIRLTSESTQHPWLIAILAQINSGLRAGKCVSGSTIDCLQRIISTRVTDLSQQDIATQEWNPCQPSQWAVPDFFAFFAEFIAMVDAGEECGELDTALFRIRDTNLNDGIVDSNESIWGRDVSLFCSAFELLHSAGIPKLNCLKMIAKTSPLRGELQTIVAEVENGSTLAKAMKVSLGQLSHPALVAIIDAGESSGELEMALIRTRRNATTR